MINLPKLPQIVACEPQKKHKKFLKSWATKLCLLNNFLHSLRYSLQLFKKQNWSWTLPSQNKNKRLTYCTGF